MKLFTASQIRELDANTLTELHIPSHELMERAAQAFTNQLLKEFESTQEFTLFCGKGNNGGDALAIARQLKAAGKIISVYSVEYTSKSSIDHDYMFDKLKSACQVVPKKITTASECPSLTDARTVIIDGLLGTGTTRPCEGLLAEVIQKINLFNGIKVSIDIPSGMPADTFNTDYLAVQSTVTYTFQFPKLAFMLPVASKHVPRFEILDIGISQQAITRTPSRFFYTTPNDLLPILKHREVASHKGQFGHAQIIAGSKGKSGAAVIAARACLRSGAGLLTVRTTQDTATALNAAIPEAMTEIVQGDFVDNLEKSERYNVIGVGPGLGVNSSTNQLLRQLLNYYKGSLVLDADAITLLADNPTWYHYLPPHTILTPHVKEFSRLIGETLNEQERLIAASNFATKYAVILVLKGLHTAIAMPDGSIHFNSTGNAGLAKGGSGDALTGIITGLLARGYNAPQSALLGVYLHGHAADILAEETSQESILATDVADKIPYAFKSLESFGLSDGLK